MRDVPGQQRGKSLARGERCLILDELQLPVDDVEQFMLARMHMRRRPDAGRDFELGRGKRAASLIALDEKPKMVSRQPI